MQVYYYLGVRMTVEFVFGYYDDGGGSMSSLVLSCISDDDCGKTLFSITWIC